MLASPNGLGPQNLTFIPRIRSQRPVSKGGGVSYHLVRLKSSSIKDQKRSKKMEVNYHTQGPKLLES